MNAKNALLVHVYLLYYYYKHVTCGKRSRYISCSAVKFKFVKTHPFRVFYPIKSTMFIISDNVPVSGFCSIHDQCTGSNNSGICEQERCTCAEGFKLVEFACKKSNINQFLTQFLSH